MIFTSLNENGNIVFNEGVRYKTKEEAERALKKVKNNEKDTFEYITWGFKTGVVLSLVGILGGLLIQAFSKWLAFPGSAKDKVKKCDTIIKKCNKTISKLEKSNNSDSKKLIDEYKKVKEYAMEEKVKQEDRVDSEGKIKSNWNESSIFDNVDFV